MPSHAHSNPGHEPIDALPPTELSAVAPPETEFSNRHSTRNGRPASIRRVLVLSSAFPSKVQPIHGVFVKERIRFLAQLPGVEVRVISPVPYFPPLESFKRWYPLSQIPREEIIDGLRVTRPRYFLPPKVGGYFHADLMYPFVRRQLSRIRREFPFDVIDAHFIYPDGVVAAMLGAATNTPVVVTCRGEDIERFPDEPLIGRRIRKTLTRATQLVAVSGPIRDTMIRLGADPGKVTLIPNGVDAKKFAPTSRESARKTLGLPADRPIVLAVGYRLKMKGYHLLIDAIPKIKKTYPDVLVAIVGGQARWGLDYSAEIEERIRANAVSDSVLLTGARPPEELPNWYSAADVLSILSSREGSPNVLMEALASGLPAVATPVGGIPDVLGDTERGILLPERSAKAAAKGIVQALERTWNRDEIRQITIQNNDWDKTARQVNQVFDRALGIASEPSGE